VGDPVIWLLACTPGGRDPADPYVLWEVTSADPRTFALGADAPTAEFSVWVDAAKESWGADLEVSAAARAVEPVVRGDVTLERLQSPEAPDLLDTLYVGPGDPNTGTTAAISIPPEWTLLAFRLEATPGLEVEVEVTPSVVTYVLQEDLGSAPSEVAFVGD
jgi:hypothetical protein